MKFKEPLPRSLHSSVERSRGRTCQDLKTVENQEASLAESVCVRCIGQVRCAGNRGWRLALFGPGSPKALRSPTLAAASPRVGQRRCQESPIGAGGEQTRPGRGLAALSHFEWGLSNLMEERAPSLRAIGQRANCRSAPSASCIADIGAGEQVWAPGVGPFRKLLRRVARRRPRLG